MQYYQSRYQARRHTTIQGKIQDVERYDRFYDIAYEALRDGRLPHLTLPAGALLVRRMTGPHDPLQIPPGSSMNTGNRFSGPRLDGRPGQGALYVATIAGVLREHTHYSLLSKTAALQPPAPRFTGLAQPTLRRHSWMTSVRVLDRRTQPASSISSAFQGLCDSPICVFRQSRR